MGKKNLAELLVDTLVSAGVKKIYGLAGDSLNGITDAIRTDERIKWIHVRHEETAAFAAGAEAICPPHRSALHAWFCFTAEEQPEYGGECWCVAAPEVSTFRRDNGKLDVDVRGIEEHVSPLGAVNTCLDHCPVRASRVTMRHQPVRPRTDETSTKDSQ